MDRRSWLWRRRSSDRSPGETESSGSASSERYSDDQEGLRASLNDSSPIDASPNHAQSQEVSSSPSRNSPIDDSPNHGQSLEVTFKSNENEEAQENVKSLTEKLSAALLNVSAKEDLVKQHTRVAEEAILGWEKAESEVAVLKQQLESTVQKNSALEDRISQLDGALKECVRQLRQFRDDQEQKVHDAVTKRTQEWESNKFKLENQLVELKKQLEDSKAESNVCYSEDIQCKLEAIENENTVLRAKLLTQSEELKVRTLERELSTQTAETASKQHLESIKKVAKLEAECRKLRSLARRTSSINDRKTISNSTCGESLTDSQSDNGDRLTAADNEPGSDSWASVLIAELDQLKNGKNSTNVLTKSVDIDLMDDFLEMEKLAAMPETDNGNSSITPEVVFNMVVGRASPFKGEDEAVKWKMVELEEKIEKLEAEKAKLEISLTKCQDQLEESCNQLTIAEVKLVELQKELELADESKLATMVELSSVDAVRKVLESQLETALTEVRELQDKVASLNGKVEDNALSSELKTKLCTLETTREAVDSQLQLAYTEIEKLQKKVLGLEGRIEEERAKSTELAAKADAVEATRRAMESQFLSADSEIRKLQEKVKSLEQSIEDERSLSMGFAAKAEALEDERKALELELQSAQVEVKKLRDKVGLLEEEIDKERTLSTQFAMKCQNIEDELSMKREAEHQTVSCSNGDLTIKQEKELAVAAKKLAECQKTIASLGQQLKSLTSLDDFLFEPGKPELNGVSLNQRNGNARTLLNPNDPLSETSSCILANGKEMGSPPSATSSTSMLSGFRKLLS